MGGADPVAVRGGAGLQSESQDLSVAPTDAHICIQHVADKLESQFERYLEAFSLAPTHDEVIDVTDIELVVVGPRPDLDGIARAGIANRVA